MIGGFGFGKIRTNSRFRILSMKHLPNVLYHGISLDNIDSLIEDGILKPYSKMRKFFGVELRDNHKDYQKSHYYSGWCTVL